MGFVGERLSIEVQSVNTIKAPTEGGNIRISPSGAGYYVCVPLQCLTNLGLNSRNSGCPGYRSDAQVNAPSLSSSPPNKNFPIRGIVEAPLADDAPSFKEEHGNVSKKSMRMCHVSKQLMIILAVFFLFLC